MRTTMFVAAMCSFAVLSGCNTVDTPLVFGKVNTFGASVAATAPDQGGNIVVGYRSANIAIVPVTATDRNGNVVRLRGHITGDAKANDAFSTFAHFEASAGAAKVCLGDTFATGLAAQKIADNLGNIAKICP